MIEINIIDVSERFFGFTSYLARQKKTWENTRKNGGGPDPETGIKTGVTAWRKEEKEVEKEIAPGPGPMRGRNRRKVSETTRGGGPGQGPGTDTRKVRGDLEDIPPVNLTRGPTPTPSAPTTPQYSSPSWS